MNTQPPPYLHPSRCTSTFLKPEAVALIKQGIYMESIYLHSSLSWSGSM